MIDPADQQNQALPLDEQQPKKRRGRPATGKAMTPAEKQRAYRERQKSNVTEIEELREKARVRGRCCIEQARMIQELEAKLAAAIERAEKAEKASKRNVTRTQTKRRYVLQVRFEDVWHDDKTGDYNSKREAEKACKRMNEPGVSANEWRVRERQWV